MSNENGAKKKTKKNPVWTIIQVVMILAIIATLLMYVNAHLKGKRYGAVSDLENKANSLSEDVQNEVGDDPLDAVTDLGEDIKHGIVGAIVGSASRQISDQVIDEVIREQAAANGVSEEEAQKIIDSVSDEDRDKVEDIVEEHLDEEMVEKATEYMKDGNDEEFMKYAMSELSAEEMAELMGLYAKYAQ